MAKAKRQEGQSKQEQVSHVSQHGMYCSGEQYIPYSGKFSLVQIFAEKRPDSSEEIFAVFIWVA